MLCCKQSKHTLRQTKGNYPLMQHELKFHNNRTTSLAVNWKKNGGEVQRPTAPATMVLWKTDIPFRQSITSTLKEKKSVATMCCWHRERVIFENLVSKFESTIKEIIRELVRSD